MHLPVVLLGALAFSVFLLVQWRWFPHLSKNNDEPVYLFQAEMLRDGHLTLPADLAQGLRPWMSGTYGDRIVMVFPPGWPAVLAVGLALFPSADVVGAAAAAFGVLATYALAFEVLRNRVSAGLAAGFVGVSPLMLVLGGTVLTYPFALGLGALAGAATLRATRLDTPRILLCAGLAAGSLLTMRPLDAVLVSGVFGLHAAWVWRRRPAALASGLGWAVVGAIPFVAIVLAVNAQVTGSPLTFPVQANGGDNRMGFGARQIAAGGRVFDVTPAMMRRVTESLLGQMPNWTLGGLAVTPLVVWGAIRIWKRRPAALPILLALAVAFPIAYSFYWGSHFVHVGRKDYGPFYYLPMLVPLGVATAEGLMGLARRSRPVAVLVLVAMVATLPASLVPKYRRARQHNIAVGREVRLVDRVPDPSLVILPGSNDGPWMLHVRGYFSNPPDLRRARLYAADTGAGNIELSDRYPDRGVYQLFGVIPGDRVEGRPDPVVRRLTRLAGPALAIRTTFTNDTDNPTVVAYVGVPDGFVRCVLDESSAKGGTYAAVWSVSADSVIPPPGCTPLPMILANGRRLNGNLVIGFSASATTELDGVNRWEYLYALRTGSSAEVLVPGVPRRTSSGDLGDPRADYPGQVDHVLGVDITAVQEG